MDRLLAQEEKDWPACTASISANTTSHVALWLTKEGKIADVSALAPGRAAGKEPCPARVLIGDAAAGGAELRVVRGITEEDEDDGAAGGANIDEATEVLKVNHASAFANLLNVQDARADRALLLVDRLGARSNFSSGTYSPSSSLEAAPRPRPPRAILRYGSY